MPTQNVGDITGDNPEDLLALAPASGDARTTQAALAISATTSYAIRTGQAALAASAWTSYTVRITQVAIGASAWTAYAIRTTQAALVAWVITCESTSYVPPADTGVITLTAVSAGADTGAIALSWNTLPGFTYALYRGTAPDGESATPIATGLTGGSYTDTGLTYHQTYYYRLVGSDVCGDETTSNEASATVNCTNPGQVLGLIAVAGPGAHQATLRWTGVAGCTYDVHRSTTPGGEGDTPIAEGIATTYWIDPYGVHEGPAYYTVAAVNACGFGEQSAEAMVVMDCCTPWTGSPKAPCPGWEANATPATAWTRNDC